MDTIRFMILCAVVMFGAYAQHVARQDVKTIRDATQNYMAVKSKVNAADMDFMKRAIDLSYVSIRNNDGGPFGSVVVLDGIIIGEGWNKTHVLKDPSAHAEVEAIRAACKRISSEKLHGSVIYTSSQPCPMCLSLIYLAGIEKVYYCIPGKMIKELNDSLSVDHIYEAISSPQAVRPVPEYPIMQQDAEAIVKSYINLKNGSVL